MVEACCCWTPSACSAPLQLHHSPLTKTGGQMWDDCFFWLGGMWRRLLWSKQCAGPSCVRLINTSGPQHCRSGTPVGVCVTVCEWEFMCDATDKLQQHMLHRCPKPLQNFVYRHWKIGLITVLQITIPYLKYLLKIFAVHRPLKVIM